jgi:hypothetical protein
VYGLIHAERASIPVARACRVLEVSRSGYCQWLHAEPSERSIDDAVLAAEIKEVFHEHKGRYGAPRIRRALRRRGARPSKKRVARLMRAQGLRGRSRGRETTRKVEPSVGHNVVFVPFGGEEDPVRPVGVSPVDGALYISSDGQGTLYRVGVPL